MALMPELMISDAGIASKLAELYVQNPKARISFDANLKEVYLDEIIVELTKVPIKEFTLDSLENSPYKKNLGFALAHLPPELIQVEFGEEALFWVWVVCNNPIRKPILFSAIEGYSRDEKQLLRKADMITQSYVQISDSRIVKQIYTLLNSLENNVLQNIDLPRLLKDCTYDGFSLSQKRIDNYKLVPFFAKNYWHCGYEQNWGNKIIEDKNRKIEKKFRVFIDAPIGIGLMYKQEPIAVVSFAPRNYYTLMIYQLQGANAYKAYYDTMTEDMISSRGLILIDWEKLLVLATEELAKETRFKSIGIQSAVNNVWTHPSGMDRVIKLKDTKAVERYDGTARRLNFHEGTGRDWYRVI